MSSKRDDDSSADMEVGMTTAERRRRRRRGGGLRVPSDNVPRRASTPPVVAPVPEDPSLAMSIAYSFTSEASEPVPRVTIETPVPTFEGVEALPTVIDSVSGPVEQQDFEMKTREMSAVDLEALGLQEPGASGNSVVRTPGIEPVTTTASSTVEVRFNVPRTRTDEDVDVMIDGGTTLDTDTESAGIDPDSEATTIAPAPAPRAAEPAHGPESGPHKTVDQGWSGPHRTVDSGWRLPAVDGAPPREPVAPPTRPSSDSRPPPLVPSPPVVPPPPSPLAAATPAPYKPGRAQTVALSEDDLEEVREAARLATTPQSVPAAPTTPPVRPSSTSNPPPMPREAKARSSDEPLSVPEIDIMALDEKAAETSGEFEVDVDGIVDAKVSDLPLPVAPPPSPTQPGTGDRRSRPSSQPPPTGGPTVRESQQLPITREGQAPPPPPAAHKAPPAPPPAKKDKPPPPAMAQKDGTKLGPKGKPWFVDLFDEDYLRTLPFLTPQATQAEAEFVIDAMGLTPGAQVLDIGCGYGRHAMELAARGMHVVGLDLSTPLLVRGGEEAHRRNLTINFIRGDMRELDFENQFDGAYCLFSTFGYFDDETNKKTVANFARALKPGGRVIIEILNRDYVIADLPTRVWWEGDGCVVLEEVELNYFSSRIQVNRSVVFDDGRQLEQEISVRAYSLHEVGKLMHAAGFRVLEVSGGYHTRGRFFGNQSRHIIVLAERKDASPT